MEFRGYQSTYIASLPPVDQTPLFQEHDSLYRLLLKACAPDPADRFVSADELRVQLLGVLREVVARGREGAAEHSTSSLLFESPTVSDDRSTGRTCPSSGSTRATPQAPWLRTLSIDDPVQRLSALEAAPEVSPEVLLARSRAALEAGRPRAGRRRGPELLVDDPWEWRAAWMIGPRRPRPRTRRPRRRARSTPSTARCRASWRRSWRWRSPARPGGEIDVAESLYVACARTDATYIAPAAFGLARIRSGRGDVAGAVRALDLVPVTSRAFTPARRRRAGLLAESGGGLPSLAAALDEHRQPDDRPGRPVALPGRRAGRGARHRGVARARTPRSPSPGRPASEPDLRDGLESAYRDLAAATLDPRGAGRARRPGERRTPVDAAMTGTAGEGAAEPRAPRQLPVCSRTRSSRRALPARPAGDCPARGASGSRGPRCRPRAARAPGDRRAAGRHRDRSAATPATCHECGGDDRRRRLLHAVRGEGRAARATTSPSSRRAGWPPSCDRGVRHTATRTPSRWTPGPSPAATPCSWSATGCRTRSTPTSPAWRPLGRLVTCSRVSTSGRIGHRRRPGRRRREGTRGGGGRGQRRRRATTPSAGPGNPASCTFVAAVVDATLLVVGLGRRQPRLLAPRRPGTPRLLTVDDSYAAEQIAARGRPRRGRDGPQAHAITRWLGVDAPDHAAATRPRWTSTRRAGCWSAPTACGTTAPSPPTWRRWCRSSRAGRRAPSRSRWPTLSSTGPTRRAAVDNITVALARMGLTRQVPRHPHPADRRFDPPAQHREEAPMATFTAEVFQNEFLPDGGTDVHAIVTVTCAGAGEAGQSGAGDAGEIVIVDTSGSMGRTKIARRPAGRRGRAGPGARRRLVRGHRREPRGAPGLPAAARRPMVPDGRPRHARRGQGRDRRLPCPTAGTAMGTWLHAGHPAVRRRPGAGAEARDPADRRHQPARDPRAADARRSRRARGQFQCDCRGVGADWQVAEVRRIATALLGSVDLIAAPGEDGRRLRADHARVDGSRGRRRLAAGVGAAGCPGAVRAPGLAHRRRPHRPAAPRSTR